VRLAIFLAHLLVLFFLVPVEIVSFLVAPNGLATCDRKTTAVPSLLFPFESKGFARVMNVHLRALSERAGNEKCNSTEEPIGGRMAASTNAPLSLMFRVCPSPCCTILSSSSQEKEAGSCSGYRIARLRSIIGLGEEPF